MEDKVANLLHRENDLINIKRIWNCKADVSQGEKRKHLPMLMRDGYIIKAKGMAIYSPRGGERITRVELSLDHFCVKDPLFYQFCDRMAQKWRGRHSQGQRGRVEGGNLP